jgi:hypothetical protein
VPEHCIFDHVHDSKLCTSYGEWNKTAAQSCSGRSMQLQSFSMLQPCGIDRFNGVEFVCCPNPDAADDSINEGRCHVTCGGPQFIDLWREVACNCSLTRMGKVIRWNADAVQPPNMG